ncbi:MAG: SUMF1/EgtB/PvdO family nonheme iron enzyme [bacterium]|nr:SUMF1/EgtB/PvdO family nonheme iron enzyme [bacterium]
MASERSVEIHADSVGKAACHKCGTVVDVSADPAFSAVTCPQCGAQFAAPGKLGGFVLLKELGRGEMGVTYKAYEKSLGRYVAIKVMHKVPGEDSSLVAGFMSEGRALAALDNPNIVRVFSLGQEKEQPYIAMELIAGGGMEKQFSAGKPLGEARTLEIITGVARALRAANEIGLIHGDVKPENIMLNKKGRPKLVDFGIARFGGGKISEGDALGTPYYVSPEQVERGSLDHRSDIYSLGATMYHAISGVPPFNGDSLMKVLYARIKGPVPDISEACPSLHPETVEVLTRMLQKDPDDRYETYDELLKGLQKASWAAGAEIIQDDGEAIPVADKLSETDWSKFRWPMVMLGIVLVIVGVWAGYFRGRGDPPVVTPTTKPVVAQVDIPVISHPGGVVSGPLEVTITCNTPGSKIYYTTNKTVPTEDSPLYMGNITVAPGTTLRARAFRDGWDKSAVVEAVYSRDKASLTNVERIRADANSEWEQVKKIDRGQGLGAKISQCAKLHSRASDLWDREAYAACLEPYTALAKLCGELKKLDAQRHAAKGAQTTALAARKAISDARSKSVSADATKTDTALKQAQRNFDKGKFTEAQKHWKTAEKHADAELSSMVTKSAAAFQAVLKKHDVKQLDKFGGARWVKARAAFEKTRSPGTVAERVVAARECGNAASDLPAIAKTAATTARDAAKTAEIKKKLQKAEKLVTEGKLREAMVEITALLKVDPSNAVATNLKLHIGRKLKLSLPMGQIKVNNKIYDGGNIELAWVPSGEFTMGSLIREKGRGSDEKPHKVQISKPFYMGTLEITHRQYVFYFNVITIEAKNLAVKELMREKGRQPTNEEVRQIYDRVNNEFAQKRKKWVVYGWNGKRWGRMPNIWWGKPGYELTPLSPVTCISWSEANAFCEWLGKRTNRNIHLPTEAQWEMACRAGAQTAFSFGDNIADLHKHGNYADKSSALSERDKINDDGQVGPQSVGKYPANPWGLKDMHGGVAEWCADRAGRYRRDIVDPSGPASGRKRIVRGGSWFSPAKRCRSAARNSLLHVSRNTATGFRIVVEIAN